MLICWAAVIITLLSYCYFSCIVLLIARMPLLACTQEELLSQGKRMMDGHLKRITCDGFCEMLVKSDAKLLPYSAASGLVLPGVFPDLL